MGLNYEATERTGPSTDADDRLAAGLFGCGDPFFGLSRTTFVEVDFSLLGGGAWYRNKPG